MRTVYRHPELIPFGTGRRGREICGLQIREIPEAAGGLGGGRTSRNLNAFLGVLGCLVFN